MKSTFALAAMSAMLSSSFASPIDSSVAVERRDDAPSVCVPAGREAQYGYSWWDESPTCQAAGVATGCCVSMLSSGAGIGCKIESREQMLDLKSAVGQQISKTGQWDSTTVGKWTATYDLFADDKVNPRVLNEWYHAMGPDDNPNIGKKEQFAYLLFSYDADDVYTRLRVGC